MITDVWSINYQEIVNNPHQCFSKPSSTQVHKLIFLIQNLKDIQFTKTSKETRICFLKITETHTHTHTHPTQLKVHRSYIISFRFHSTSSFRNLTTAPRTQTKIKLLFPVWFLMSRSQTHKYTQLSWWKELTILYNRLVKTQRRNSLTTSHLFLNDRFWMCCQRLDLLCLYRFRRQSSL